MTRLTHLAALASPARPRLPSLAALGLFALLLSACPPTGIVCRAGTVRCGDGCIDPAADKLNCGACGIACATGQVCSNSACQCQADSQLCGGACVVTASDAKHCGTCDHACATGQVCEAGQCKATCTLGVTVLCGSSCVDLHTDVGHCGTCEVACQSGQSCRGGRCTYDVVAACSSSGQVVGVQATSEVRGPREPMGTGPAALASFDDVLLAADGIDKRLYQANLRGPANLLASYATYNGIGAVANQVLVDKPYVYVVNAETGTLQVLQQGVVADGGVGMTDAGLTGGLVLATVAELPLGANTYPEGMAKVGSSLWIPLYGGYTAATAGAGQKVVRVSVADPTNPVLTADVVDLTALDLHAFDGGAPLPRPAAITVHQGMLYVVLNNLDLGYAAAGSGLLARIDPTTKQASVVDLGASTCLDPQWLASDGQRLVVSCMGRATYDMNYALVGTEKSGLVMVVNDAVVASWSPTPCAVLADGGAGCPPALPGRFALQDGRVYLGDQNGGRVYVLDVSATGFGERRGYAGDAGEPVYACPVDATTGYGNVSDVLAVP